MSSALWDWTQALLGLRPIGDIFLPTYWSIPAQLTARSGWVLSPGTILFLLVLVSLLGVAGYVWKRQYGFINLAFAIWGGLLADTPYAVFLPIALFALWPAVLRVERHFKVDAGDEAVLPWRFVRIVYVLAFLVVFVMNLARCGVAYIPGYVRNAIQVVRWDGGYHPFDTRLMDRLLDEYVTELAREAAGKRWIVTDGLCDAGIELKGTARTVSLAMGAQKEEYWQALGFTQQEDLSALQDGPSALLRAWAVDHPNELTNAVFQSGFAFLEKAATGKLVPHGLVLRTPAAPDAHADAATRALAEGILKFYRRGGDPAHGGHIRQARFCTMQWRVARAIRRQALALDRQVRTREALAVTAISEELDRLNPYAKRQNGLTEAADLRAFGSLTPREGLAFALKRANFTLARQFALPIVRDQPGNLEANFALAMSHLSLQEYAQARHYFQIALKARPNDATLLNNCAVSSMMLGDLTDAEQKAQAALKAKPDSEAIKDTLRKIALAKKER